MISDISTARPSPRLPADLDPTLFAIFNNRYFSIAEEMTYCYERSAASPVISLARDFSCAILTANGDLIAIWEGVPHHVTGLHLIVRSIIAAFENDLTDGDVVITNDPYLGNTHVADLILATPVFVDDEIVCWSVAKGHQLDVGATAATSQSVSARNVWSEGNHIPPIKLWERGNLRRDLLRLYLANVRYPDLVEGDLYAQHGTLGVGRRRMLELYDEFGRDTVLHYSQALLDYANRRTRDEISGWPDGTYESVAWMDSDGTGRENVRICASMSVSGDRVSIDLTGSDPQVPGSTNASYGTTITSAILPILCAIPSDIPHNQGCIDCIAVTPGEPGTVTNPRWPAATAGCTSLTGDVISEAVWKCIAQAKADIAVAGVAKCSGMAFGCGVDRRSGQALEYGGIATFNLAGGFGASRGHDGWPGAATYGALGCLKFMDVELQELLFPLLYERLEAEQDSCGAGRWIGGPGIRAHVRAYGGTVELFVFGEGATNPPFGLVGGFPGVGGGQFVDGDDRQREFYNCKAHVELEDGDRWVCVSAAGGGYGDPFDRDPDRVCEDVRDGLFSAETATARFGVVLTNDGVLDPVTTAAARRLRPRRQLIDPMTSATGAWHLAFMRPGERLILDRE